MAQHVRARHAMLAKQFVVELAGDPIELQNENGPGADEAWTLWVALIEQQLRRLCPAAHPALAPLAVAAATEIQGTDRLQGQAVWAVPQSGILALMLRGLVSLGPVSCSWRLSLRCLSGVTPCCN